MPQLIQVGNDVIEFPDNMSDEQIAAALSGGQQPVTPAPEIPPQENTAIDHAIGAADVLAGGMAGLGKQAVEGIANIGGLATGRGADYAAEYGQAVSGSLPEYEIGKQGQQVISAIAEKYQAAPEIIKDIVSTYGSLGEWAGTRTMDITGSPGVAATARIVPEALEAGIGFLTGMGAAKAAKPAAKKVASEAADRALSPTKKKIRQLLVEGSTDKSTAKFKLDAPATPELKLPAPGKAPDVLPSQKLKDIVEVTAPKMVKDAKATEAIKQGFDEGVIAAVKGASPADKKSMTKMVDVMRKGKENKLFAMRNRPSDVVGDSLMKRFRAVHNANRKAGKELDGVARSLKGQKVDYSPAVNTFIDDLQDMGIGFGDDLKPRFSGSDIEGVAGAERVITQIVNRMKNTKTPDAHDIHRLKRYIDEQVTYGKNAEGLAGKSEQILKKLRRNLDETLDSNFPEYDSVNTTYSETIGALDDLQDVAGRKMDLTGESADKAVGTLLRRVMSNAQSRVRLLDSVDNLEAVAVANGGKFSDDLMTQILFVDELDSVFGPVARTSFQGQIKQGVGDIAAGVAEAKVSPLTAAMKGAARGADKARGISQESGFNAITELLKGTE